MGKLLDTLKANGVEITEDIEKKVMEEFIEKKDSDLKDTEITNLKEQLKTRDKDIEELKKTDGTKVKEELTTLQDKYKKDTEALKKELADTQFESALDLALSSVNAKDSGIIKTLLDKEKIQFKDGKFEGLTEQLETMKKEKEFLFNAEENKASEDNKQKQYTYTPVGGKASSEPTTLNDAVAQAMGYAQ